MYFVFDVCVSFVIYVSVYLGIPFVLYVFRSLVLSLCYFALSVFM